MNDPLFEAFANTKEQEFPESLHRSILRRVLFERYYRAVVITGMLLVLSLASSTVNLFIAAANRDLHHLVKLAMDNFELNIDYLTDFGSMIADAVPVRAFTVFLFNALLGGYMLWFARKAKRTMRTDFWL